MDREKLLPHLSKLSHELRDGDRLILIDCAHSDMRDTVHFLEHHGWTLHHSAQLGDGNYLLELSVSDESVQS